MKNFGIKTLLSFVLIVSIFACEGPAGEVGPQGTQGDQGDQGPAGADGTDGAAGADGTDGAAGADGNANVISSAWFTPDAYTLIEDVYGIDYIEHDLSAPEITQGIIDSGVVLVYGKLEGYVNSVWPDGQISLMPIVINTILGDAAETDTWSALILTEIVKIRFVNSINRYSTVSKSHSFRYVVIPSPVISDGRVGSLSAKVVLEELRNAGVDTNDIDQVLDYYNY